MTDTTQAAGLTKAQEYVVSCMDAQAKVEGLPTYSELRAALAAQAGSREQQIPLQSMIYSWLMHHGKPATVSEFERASAVVADALARGGYLAAQAVPVTVPADADADEMNRKHGEDYGSDWVYPAPAEAKEEPKQVADLEKIQRDVLGDVRLTLFGKITEANLQHNSFDLIPDAAWEVIREAVKRAINLTAREVADPVWPYAKDATPVAAPALTEEQVRVIAQVAEDMEGEIVHAGSLLPGVEVVMLPRSYVSRLRAALRSTQGGEQA